MSLSCKISVVNFNIVFYHLLALTFTNHIFGFIVMYDQSGWVYVFVCVCVFASLYLSLVPSFGDRIQIELIQ